MDIFKNKWEESYNRGENFIFYPKEEVVKFVNRFVRKRIGLSTFTDILNFSKSVRGLDFGCGIGRQTILMREFGIDAYGYDISASAITEAKKLAQYFGYTDMTDKFIIGDGQSIPFDNDFFDLTVSESTLDSMSFELAKKILAEIARVTKNMAFLSLISGDVEGRTEHDSDFIVDTEHEKGTVQSYYTLKKIQQLLSGKVFKIRWCYLVREEGVDFPYHSGRYYLVLQKE